MADLGVGEHLRALEGERADAVLRTFADDDDEVDVANRPELVLVDGRAVVDDLELKPGPALVVAVGPRLEVGGELVVGHDVDRADVGDGREVVEHPFEHRLAGHVEERLGFVEGERVQARGVAGGEDEDVHGWFLEMTAFGKFDVVQIDAVRLTQPQEREKSNRE